MPTSSIPLAKKWIWGVPGASAADWGTRGWIAGLKRVSWSTCGYRMPANPGKIGSNRGFDDVLLEFRYAKFPIKDN